MPEVVVMAGGAPGLEDVPHVLYLGSDSLFGRKETLDVTLIFTVESGDASLLAGNNLRWRKLDKDQKTWVVTPAIYSAAGPGQVKVVLTTFGNNGKTAVAGQVDSWVACAFEGSLPAGISPRISSIQGGLSPSSSSSGVVAGLQKAFADDLDIDLSRPARPFGERPRYGHTFCLMSQRAFAPEVSQVTVTFKVKKYEDTVLQTIFSSIAAQTKVTTVVTWQYLAENATWKKITEFEHTLTATPAGAGKLPTITRTINRDGVITTSEDGTFFTPPGSTVNTASFSFTRPADMALGKVKGEEGYWIRALLKSDDPYGRDAFVASSNPLKVVDSTLIPPVVESVELSFGYKSQLRSIDRVVSENNLARVIHQVPGPGKAIQPFVPLQDVTLSGDGGSVAFGGDPALYLGFDQPFGDRYISLYLKLKDHFPSVDTPAEQGAPTLAWEYLVDSLRWKPLDVSDETARLTGSGTVSFLGPSDSVAFTLFDAVGGTLAKQLCWYRVRLASGRYDFPPALQGVYANTVLADNRYTIRKEAVLGSGSGEKDQRLVLPRSPVLGGELWVREPEAPSQAELDALVAEHRLPSSFLPGSEQDPAPILDPTPVREVWVRWRRVPNFFGSGPRNRHYTLDPLNGEIALGNGQLGMLPPVAKDNLVFRRYRTGGGEAAVRAAAPLAVKELKSSLPWVEKVFNVDPAAGGSDPWSLRDIFVFGPQSIKNKGRAVSAEDFEWMVLQRFSQIARAKCLSIRAPGATGLVRKPGAVTLIVVPKSRERVPRPSSALLDTIRDYLSAQCLGNVTQDVHVLGPSFKEVAVQARIHALDQRTSSDVERRAMSALESFFHPLYGGESGRGWDFGRDVQRSEVFAVLQRVEGVDYVESAQLLGATGASSLEIGEYALVHSGDHLIEMI
jgi:hypothetical protein